MSSSYRMMKEVLIMLSVVGGAAIGWSAGYHFGGHGAAEVIGAFSGWALVGGFADMCLQKRKGER